MKVKKGFNLRSVCGESVIIGEGVENIDFSKVISLNESAAYLWKNVCDKSEFSVDDLVSLLTSEYEVDDETALKDCQSVAKSWLDAGIIE